MNVQSSDNLDRYGSLQKSSMKNRPKLFGDISEMKESDFVQSNNKQKLILPSPYRD